MVNTLSRMTIVTCLRKGYFGEYLMVTESPADVITISNASGTVEQRKEQLSIFGFEKEKMAIISIERQRNAVNDC